jgi:hypothetical protein
MTDSYDAPRNDGVVGGVSVVVWPHPAPTLFRRLRRVGPADRRSPDAGRYRRAQVSEGLDKAMQGYERFLHETPDSALNPEAMRRLADLKIEKEYGIQEMGTGSGRALEAVRIARRTAQPMPAATTKVDAQAHAARREAIGGVYRRISERELEAARDNLHPSTLARRTARAWHCRRA